MAIELFHCSFEEVSEFIPRIPKQRCPSENSTIPRISVALTIKDCLNAIPQGPEVLHILKKLEMPMVIHVYQLAGSYMDFLEIAKYVPDAIVTKECWITEKATIVFHKVIQITELDTEKVVDKFDVEHRTITKLSYIDIHDTTLYNNMVNLAHALDLPEEIVKSEPFTKVDFRNLIYNLSENLIELKDANKKKSRD